MENLYVLERKEPYPFRVRHEALKNMTNLPERWKTIRISRKIEDLEGFIDENHRIIDWYSLEVIRDSKGL